MVPPSDARPPDGGRHVPREAEEHTTPAGATSEPGRASGDTDPYTPEGMGGPPEAPSAPAELRGHPRYLLLERLGSGGMGVVYKARHRLMDRLVALKVVRSELVDRPAMVSRFEREVRAAARLSHPNIVQAFDAETCGPLHFLVMEYVSGGNLADILAREGRMAVARACEFARQAAVGLQHAFVRGMVHRDIKPHNLIVSGDAANHGRPAELVKILDFGLARFIQETQPPAGESACKTSRSFGGGADCPETFAGTDPGSLMGTSNYIAPEQADDPRSADIRADIYSLGCTLYHLLAGQPPFAGIPEADKVEAHHSMTPPPLGTARPDVPPELAQVVGRMLAKDPEQRYQTPAEVADALAPFAALEPAPAKRARRGGRRWYLLLIGLVLGALLGAGAVALYRHFFRGRPKDGDHRSVPFGREQRLFKGHTRPVSGVAYSEDGLVLLSGSYDGTLRSWDGHSGRPLRVFRGHCGTVRGVALSADGTLALSAGQDRTARVWDVPNGRELRCFRKHTKVVTSVALSPDGTLALSGGGDGLRFWKLATAEEVRSLPYLTECVAFSPDGRRAASGSDDGTVFFWDVGTGTKIHSRRGHHLGVRSVAFSPDGKRLVSGSEDSTVAVWDVAGGKCLRRWQAHEGYVWGVDFSADGKRVLSAGWDGPAGHDGTARLWDAATGEELQRFAPHAQEVLCGALAPDGGHAVCGCADKCIHQWELPP